MVRHTRWVAALVSVGLGTAATGLGAQEQASLHLAKNLIFAELATIIVIGNVSVNYERRLNESLSARVGVGVGYGVIFDSEIGGGGATGMLVFTTSRSASKFEAGLGVSYVSVGFSDPDNHVFPAITLGYRHQRPQGGFVFRVGANWTYLYGLPVQVSFGHAF